MKYPYYIRMAILLCIGAFAPIMIHHIVYKLWDVSVLRAAEITFILCIPIAYWMTSKINERWHDDREQENLGVLKIVSAKKITLTKEYN